MNVILTPTDHLVLVFDLQSQIKDEGSGLIMIMSGRSHSYSINLCTFSFQRDGVAKGFVPATWGFLAADFVPST